MITWYYETFLKKFSLIFDRKVVHLERRLDKNRY